MSSKNATIHDVATRSGVSIGTVSAVLNRKKTVSEETRKRVLQAISDLQYRPSAAARRRLQPTTAKSIGLIVKEVGNPYFADIIFGVQEAAREHGYQVLVGHTERSCELEQRLTELLVAKDVNGLIINPLLDDKGDLPHLSEVLWTNVPLVLIEGLRGIRTGMVDVDNVAAEREVVEHLLGLGHRRIVHFAGPRYSAHSAERIEGFRAALHESPLGENDPVVLHAGASLEDGYRAGLAYDWNPGDGRPTAVTCYNDLVAIGVLRALRERGLRVPEDVSVVGFDDIDMASYLSVPLTTVRMPRREIGRRSTEMLIRAIEAAGAATPETVFLETELVVRASTAAPAA